MFIMFWAKKRKSITIKQKKSKNYLFRDWNFFNYKTQNVSDNLYVKLQLMIT